MSGGGGGEEGGGGGGGVPDEERDAEWFRLLLLLCQSERPARAEVSQVMRAGLGGRQEGGTGPVHQAGCLRDETAGRGRDAETRREAERRGLHGSNARLNKAGRVGSNAAALHPASSSIRALDRVLNSSAGAPLLPPPSSPPVLPLPSDSAAHHVAGGELLSSTAPAWIELVVGL